MKGINEIKLYLGSGNALSVQVAKDILPSTDVDRDALLHVLIDQQKELAALRAASASASVKASSAKASSELDAATPSFVPAAQNASGNGSGNGNARAKNDSQEPEQPREEKPEAERLCVSMWGVKECPGTSDNECVRKHFPLCHSPLCFGRPDRRKTCTEENNKWHGHMAAQYRAAVRADKKHKREQTERKEFAEFKKMKHKGNWKPPSAQRGTNKNLKAQEPKPPKESKETKRKQSHNHAQRRGKWAQPRPGPQTLGDHFPNLPRPAQPGSVWGNPPQNTAWAPTQGAPTSVQELLLSLKALLNSGVV